MQKKSDGILLSRLLVKRSRASEARVWPTRRLGRQVGALCESAVESHESRPRGVSGAAAAFVATRIVVPFPLRARPSSGDAVR
jgi:hypothetical protein